MGRNSKHVEMVAPGEFAVERLLRGACTSPLTRQDLRFFAFAHACHQLSQSVGIGGGGGWLLALGLVACLASLRWPRWAMLLAAVAGAAQCILLAPSTGNHVYLGVVVSLLLASVEDDSAFERAHVQASLVALPVLAFFWGGVQKVIHGYWSRGQFLAHSLEVRADIGVSLRPFVDSETLARLDALPLRSEHAGPFELTGAWVLLSNAVWVAELAIPLVLLVPVLRRRAWLGFLALTWGIQLIAHEWQFAMLLTNLALLCAGPRVARIGWGVVLVCLLVLALQQANLLQLPEWLVPTAAVAGGAR